jgi:intein-encoded DNA endonuclease-like protein
VYLCQGENNLGLLRKIIDTLGKLGIKTSYRLSDRKHTLRKFYGKSYWLNENMYRLRVFKESVEDWIEVVGQKMMHPKKVERINQLRKLIKIYGDQ